MQPIGVVAPELYEEQIYLLSRCPGFVFVDSGAFGEVNRHLEVVNPITSSEWDSIISLYFRLSRSLRSRLSVVAPDRIGDQEVTLSRMKTYAEDLYEMSCLGSRILVPIQGGSMSMAKFWEEAQAVLGSDGDIRYVPAVPLKKGATTVSDLALFMKVTDVEEVHLLGLGPSSNSYNACLAVCGDAYVTCDSNAMTAKIGTNPIRPLTSALYKAEEHILSLLGPKKVTVGGSELMLCGAGSESSGHRTALLSNSGKANTYTRKVLPMRNDPYRLRQIKKILAIIDVFEKGPI